MSQLSTSEDRLQTLIEREAGQSDANSILLGVHSGDGTLRFKGASGGVTPDSPYFLASVTKMFTATVIMQLVDEERLTLDDRIQPYLSHLPMDGIHVYKGKDYSGTLTVAHLLHQTSGLADYFADGLVEDFKQNRDHLYSVEDVLEMIRGQPPFAAPDSGKSHYSDTNYQLLGALIEAITGRSLSEAFKKRIFEPLEMVRTYLFSYESPPSTTPLPFFYDNTKLSIPMAITSERGTGGAVSTIDDSHRFLRAYFQGGLFNKAHFDRMMAWNRMFFPMQYGLGLWRFQLPRWMTLFQKFPEFIGHAGVNGAMAFYNPDRDVFITGTLNQLNDPARQFKVMPKVIRAISRA